MASTPLGTLKNKIIFAVVWLTWSLMQVKILQDWGLPWQVAAIDSLVSNGLLAAIAILISNILRFYRPKKSKYIYFIIICAAKAGLWTAIVKYAMINIFPDQTDYLEFLTKFMPVRFYLTLLITGCVALISELFYTLEEQKDNEHRKTDAEKLAREAELFKLRQQLQPHFLFNSLNSISALITIQPAQARKMIQQLSDFLTRNFKERREPMDQPGR